MKKSESKNSPLKRIRIFEFDPQIYPRKLWIVVGGKYGDVKDEFEEIGPLSEHAYAETISTRWIKSPGSYIPGGVLVRFESLESMTIQNIVHESNHVAMEIFEFIGAEASTSNQEPLAYLAGWVGDCMEKVKNELSAKSQEQQEKSKSHE